MDHCHRLLRDSVRVPGQYLGTRILTGSFYYPSAVILNSVFITANLVQSTMYLTNLMQIYMQTAKWQIFSRPSRLAFCHTVNWHVVAVCRSGYHQLCHTPRQAVRSIVWVASKTKTLVLSSGLLQLSVYLWRTDAIGSECRRPCHYWYSRSDHITPVLRYTGYWYAYSQRQRVDGRWLAFRHNSCRRCSWATTTFHSEPNMRCDADIQHLRRVGTKLQPASRHAAGRHE